MEEFSVTELANYRWHEMRDNCEKIEDLIATNLAVSGIRSYNLEPDFSEMGREQALSLLVHDAAVEVYRTNSELESEEYFDIMASNINSRVSQEDNLDSEIVFDNVRGFPVNEVVQSIADYYGENFRSAQNIEIEKVLENNDFHGRADIVRDVNGDTELRDIKTCYTDAAIPGSQDSFKLACYALISRNQLDIDSFILEYPLQSTEIEIEPENWFGEVAEKAGELEDLLEEGREKQADLLQPDFGRRDGESPREFVEGLDLPYDVNKSYARSAVPDAVRE